MTLTDVPLIRLDGRAEQLSDYSGQVLLIVNVASRCGFAPQYEALERLHRTYQRHGFSVLGFPCTQFAQELKDSSAIADYCSSTWGVTFPMFETTKVNGRHKHPLFAQLHRAKDPAGLAGPVLWNFEKFVVTPEEVSRFRSPTSPDDSRIVELIERSLPS